MEKEICFLFKNWKIKNKIIIFILAMITAQSFYANDLIKLKERQNIENLKTAEIEKTKLVEKQFAYSFIASIPAEPTAQLDNESSAIIKSLKSDIKPISYSKTYPVLSTRKINLELCQKTNANPHKKEIENYVLQIFGKYSKDAFIILSKENSSLNPDAFNVNLDKYQSIDNGIFQINDYWNRYRYSDICELYDWKRNIEIAYDIFVERGYSWQAWSTCKYLKPCY